MKMRGLAAVLLVLLLMFAYSTCVRSVGVSTLPFGKSGPGFDRETDMFSDGESGIIVEPVSGGRPGVDFTATDSCEETYGFMPCTKSLLGNLFLVVAYGYVLYIGATFLSDGCELLLAVLGPGIIGGLLLPILGALPDAMLILVSGLSGSKTTAQAQVLIGMGLLAGSTIMLLTVLWGSCLIVGKCDFSEEFLAIDFQDTKKCSLLGSGITTDKSTNKAARIMVLSIIPFLIVQIAQIIHSSSDKRKAVLVACVTAIACLLFYCLYQVLVPWIQKRRIAYSKHKRIISAILRNVHHKYKEWGSLLNEGGQPDIDLIQRIFNALDQNNDGYLSRGELLALLLGLELHDQQATQNDALDKVMAEFDSSGDNQLNFEEFKEGMSTWLQLATSSVGQSNKYSRIPSLFHSRTIEELDNIENEEEEVTEVDVSYKTYLKAVFLILGGAILAGIFADPLVDAVDNFSDAIDIPSFFVSFIAMPLATNSSESVSAFIFASRKGKRTASLTYSEIYGAVTMNNTLCLGVFLAIVYFRGLDWDFSAEVLVILIVVLVMGLLSSFRTTLPLWMSLIAFLLYPLTLAIVYILDYVLGWS